MAVYGIMGGTFDPIHNGHIRLGKAALKKLRLDGVIFMPDRNPPHKKTFSSAEDRLAMVEMALEGEKRFIVSTLETDRVGTTYTIDTLQALHSMYPEDQFILIVGADVLKNIENWHCFAEIVKLLAGIAYASRSGEAKAAATACMLQQKYSIPFTAISEKMDRISSTEIRRNVERNLDIGGLTPVNVVNYIGQHRLYQNKMLNTLQETLKYERYRHTLGVEETAMHLASIYGEDVDRASTAALLHDCAKCMPVADMQHMIEKYHEQIPEPDEAEIPLLHSIAGVAVAMEKYGITDKEILSAIRWHTSGCAGMTRLEKIIYLADFIEPNRKSFPGLDEIRETAEYDLDKAVLMSAMSTKRYVLSQGLPLNKFTDELIQDLSSRKQLEELQQ